jgi:hypothetical protein
MGLLQEYREATGLHHCPYGPPASGKIVTKGVGRAEVGCSWDGTARPPLTGEVEGGGHRAGHRHGAAVPRVSCQGPVPPTAGRLLPPLVVSDGRRGLAGVRVLRDAGGALQRSARCAAVAAQDGAGGLEVGARAVEGGGGVRGGLPRGGPTACVLAVLVWVQVRVLGGQLEGGLVGKLAVAELLQGSTGGQQEVNRRSTGGQQEVNRRSTGGQQEVNRRSTGG